jgi:hypothetical protein
MVAYAITFNLEWKRLLHHYYDPFPIVELFELVVANPAIN